MLYTTYFSKFKDIPETAIKLIITRFPPKWLDINKHAYLYVEKTLSPSQNILLKYKEDNDWDSYVEAFNNEMETREDLMNMLNEVEEYIKNNNDIYLLCCEKDHTKCHRYLIAKHLESRGIQWQEFLL